MQATKTNLKKVCKAYRDTLDLTSFIRNMKLMGYTKMSDILSAFRHEYDCHCNNRKTETAYAKMLYGIKDVYRRDVSVPFVREDSKESILDYWKRMRRDDNYLKVVIYGNKNLYLAHPCYQHEDYNKSIFAENTPKNVERAKIVNRFLCSFPGGNTILETEWEGNRIVK